VAPAPPPTDSDSSEMLVDVRCLDPLEGHENMEDKEVLLEVALLDMEASAVADPAEFDAEPSVSVEESQQTIEGPCVRSRRDSSSFLSMTLL